MFLSVAALRKKFFLFIQDIYFVTLECQRLVDLHVDPKKKKKNKKLTFEGIDSAFARSNYTLGTKKKQKTSVTV